LRAVAPDLEVLVVSVLDDASLDHLRDTVWRLTGLIRVFLRVDDEVAEEPLALDPGVTVRDVADAIHHELGAVCTGARIWGPSARFDGQRVGPDHPVADGDTVEVLSPA
jgi:ribosome-interacting GTPase 1